MFQSLATQEHVFFELLLSPGRYVYELFHKKKEISRELLDFCIRECVPQLISLALNQTHSLSLTLTHSHFPSFTPTYSHALSLTLTHFHQLSLTLTQYHSPSLTLTNSHPLSLTFSHSLSLRAEVEPGRVCTRELTNLRGVATREAWC